MADVPAKIDFEVEDNATSVLKSIRREWQRTFGTVDKASESTDKAAESTEKMDEKSKGLIGSLDKMDVAAGAAAAGITAFAAQGVQAFEETEEATKRFEFRLRTLGQTQGDITRINRQLRGNFERTAFSVEAQQEALTRLATKTGDLEQSQVVLKDAMDLAAASGEDLTDVAKDLGEAATGDINALEELGILTEADTDRLREMEDATRRASGAFDILRQKVGGASDEIDPQVKQLRQMKSGYRELNSAAGEFVLTAGEIALRLVSLNQLSGENVTATQKMADTLRKANEGLGFLGEYVDDIKDIGAGVDEQGDAVLKLHAGLNMLAGNEEKAARLTRIRLGITKEQTTAQEQISEAIRKYGRDSKEAEIAARRYNETLRETNQLSRDQQRINSGFAGRRFPELEGGNPVVRPNQTDPVPDPDEDPGKQYASKAELERRKANIEYEAEQRLQDRLAELRKERRDREFDEEMEARERKANAEIQAIEDAHQKWLENHEERKNKALGRVEGQRRALRTGFEGAAGGFSDAGSMIGGFNDELSQIEAITDAEQERLDVMREQNRSLQETLDHMSSMATAGGDVAMSLDAMFQKQWDFQEAASDTVSAFGAMAEVGGAVAGITTDSAKEQAKVQGAIHAAAAIGSAAFGLMYPNPQYWSAAAQHGIAAGSYFAVAGSAQGGQAASSIGGASGGGGSGGGRGLDINAPDLGTVKDINKQAFAEALRETRNEGQQVTYVIDQSGSTFLERDPATANKVNRTLRDAERNTLRLGA
jgi:hypothetical protein